MALHQNRVSISRLPAPLYRPDQHLALSGNLTVDFPSYGATKSDRVRVLWCCTLQMANDISKAKADIAAAEQRQQELQQLVQQAKPGKEDTVSNGSGDDQGLKPGGSCAHQQHMIALAHKQFLSHNTAASGSACWQPGV